MEQIIVYTPTQLDDLKRMGEALALVPEDKRQSASYEAAAYIRGFASGVQSMLRVQPTG